MDHIGIDVHKKDSQICILAEGGELMEQRIRTERECFAAVLGERSRARIVIEASTDSEWVGRCLEGVGHQVVVADPNFPPARDAIVRPRTRYISLIRALLRQQGYRVPSGSAEGFLSRVRALTLPGRLVSTIAPLLAVMRHLNAQLAYSDETIACVTAHDARVQRLRTVPSVGPVTAAAFVATLDDAQRFRHAHQVEAYLGLVPRELSSGETQRRGHITKAGPPRMRWLLVQVAVSILRRRPPQAEALPPGGPPTLRIPSCAGELSHARP